MKHNIYKTLIAIFSICFVYLSLACSNKNKAETSKTKDTETHQDEHEHGEDNIVVLTKQQMQTVAIELGPLEQKQLAATLKINGVLKVPNTNKANATSLFGGIIKTLNVQVGDVVKKGQVIATISNPQFIQLQEEYLNAKNESEFAEQELKRQNELNDGNVGARKNLQKATADLNSLRTRKASLYQQIQLMGINPNTISNANLKASLIITSPLSGIISEVYAKIGSYVDVSFPIAEVVENKALHLDLQVYEKDLPMIKVGQKIDFVITNNPNKTYKAQVFNIGSSFNNSTKTIAVHSMVIDDKTGLIDGMNINGLVYLNNILTTAVPVDAIVNADGKYYIFVLKQPEPHIHNEEDAHVHEEVDGIQLEKIEVITGATELGYTAITPVTEISKNSQIVVKGAFFVNAKLTNSGDGHAH